MARKLRKRHIRKIQYSHGSYFVTLPVDAIRKFGWQEKQKVEVLEYGKHKLIIKDWKRKRAQSAT